MTSSTYSREFADFLEELGAEETVDREFKEATGGLPRSIWETISAFANTSGGIIVLGVQERNDDLALAGVPNPRRLLDELHSQSRNTRKINQDVLPPGSVSMRNVDNVDVVVVRVRPAERSTRPVFVNGQAYGGTYVRRHTGDHVATNDEVNRMMREASDLSADLVILPWVTLDHLDQEAITAYRLRVLARDPGSPLAAFEGMELLEAIEGYRSDSHLGEAGITVAGLLMFGKETAIRGWRVRHLFDARLLPPGADSGEPDWADRVLWESHLFGAYNRIYPWLTRDLPVPFRLENGVRIDESEQHRALREALVNLLVHADYAERDASLILRWDGGVLFRNPGRSRIPSPGFHSGNRSDPRNPALLRMFRRIGLAEEAGTGVPRIFRSWRELGYEPPAIDPGNDRYEFAITLPYGHLLSDEDREWLAGFATAFTDAEQLALVIARHEDGVDNQALREVTGLHGADVSRVLTGLRDHGFLDMVGSKRGAWYLLAPQNGSNGPADVALDRRGDVTIGREGRERFEYATLSTGSSGLSSGSSGLSTGSSELSTGSSGLSSGGSGLSEQLLTITASIRGRRRIAPERLAEIVVELCGTQPLSLRELMTLLDRSEKRVRVMLDTLMDSGRIQTLYDQRQHPRQKYTARLDQE